ncbi:MAG: hypothetical protein LLF97_05940 [Planctomycetaceae bacterium]|nr:hypothetical protein [Planctomycetaceae bacterium]
MTKLDVVLTAVLAATLGGCAESDYVMAPESCPSQPGAMVPVQPTYANPILIPAGDCHAAWEQVVDVVDDYFPIQQEEPIRLVGNSMTEGHLTTTAQVSPTIFEPWRHDTGDSQQRWENTLQTMRRRAEVRMKPAQGGYEVDVRVYRELESLPRPEHATTGGATFRYDSALDETEQPVTGPAVTKNWIPQGRDTALEQQIIADLLNRCGSSPQPTVQQAVAIQPQPAAMPSPQLSPVPSPPCNGNR